MHGSDKMVRLQRIPVPVLWVWYQDCLMGRLDNNAAAINCKSAKQPAGAGHRPASDSLQSDLCCFRHFFHSAIKNLFKIPIVNQRSEDL